MSNPLAAMSAVCRCAPASARSRRGEYSGIHPVELVTPQLLDVAWFIKPWLLDDFVLNIIGGRSSMY
jgi:hypothetical protein